MYQGDWSISLFRRNLNAVAPRLLALAMLAIVSSCGFQIQGAVAPSLQNFAPYGNGRNVAVDLRPQICSAAAVKARYERGDDDGMLVQRSPYLTAMDHEPRAVTIGLGGATGPAPSVPRFADVPIPTPRPDYPFKSATAETGQGG